MRMTRTQSIGLSSIVTFIDPLNTFIIIIICAKAMAWARPSQGQAMKDGFGLAHNFMKPKPLQAKAGAFGPSWAGTTLAVYLADMSFCQGTWQFMARDLVQQFNIWHTFTHNLESFFWVLFWIVLTSVATTQPAVSQLTKP